MINVVLIMISGVFQTRSFKNIPSIEDFFPRKIAGNAALYQRDVLGSAEEVRMVVERMDTKMDIFLQNIISFRNGCDCHIKAFI